MNLWSRLPLWSRKGLLWGAATYYRTSSAITFSISFCICQEVYLLVFLTNHVQRAGLSLVRRWKICVKLELFPSPSPRNGMPHQPRKRMLDNIFIIAFLLLALCFSLQLPGDTVIFHLAKTYLISRCILPVCTYHLVMKAALSINVTN